MEDKFKDFLTHHRDSLEREAPSEQVWASIQESLAHQRPQRKSRMMYYWSAAAAVLLVLGISAAWLMNISSSDSEPTSTQLVHGDRTTTPASTHHTEADPKSVEQVEILAPKNAAASDDLKAVASVSTKLPQENLPLDKELPTQKRLQNQESEILQQALVLMLNPNSATKRLEGILILQELQELSPTTLDVVQYIVTNDRNSNVRMAALDIFLQHVPIVQQEQKVQEIFVQQDDPSLQIELLAAMNMQNRKTINTATAEKLQEITEDPLAIDYVKDQALAVLMNTTHQ